MASLAVASSVNVAASASSLSGVRVTGASRNGPVSVKMGPVRCQAKSDAEVVQRRAVVAGAAAAMFALVSSAPVLAVPNRSGDPIPEPSLGEPKKGSAEAKKKYAKICVTMPTASICHG